MTPETQAAILRAQRTEGAPEPWDRPGCLPDGILALVTKLANTTREEMLGRRRHRAIARPRQIVYALIHEFCHAMSWAEIGMVMNRERASVCHGVKILPGALLREPGAKHIYDEAKRRLAAR